MSSTWTVESGQAVWDGRRLDEWSEVVVADLVLNSEIGVEWAACFHAQQAAE